MLSFIYLIAAGILGALIAGLFMWRSAVETGTKFSFQKSLPTLVISVVVGIVLAFILYRASLTHWIFYVVMVGYGIASIYLTRQAGKLKLFR